MLGLSPPVFCSTRCTDVLEHPARGCRPAARLTGPLHTLQHSDSGIERDTVAPIAVSPVVRRFFLAFATQRLRVSVWQCEGRTKYSLYAAAVSIFVDLIAQLHEAALLFEGNYA